MIIDIFDLFLSPWIQIRIPNPDPEDPCISNLDPEHCFLVDKPGYVQSAVDPNKLNLNPNPEYSRVMLAFVTVSCLIPRDIII